MKRALFLVLLLSFGEAQAIVTPGKAVWQSAQAQPQITQAPIQPPPIPAQTEEPVKQQAGEAIEASAFNKSIYQS